MLPAFRDILPALQPLQNVLRESPSGVRDIDIHIFFILPVLRVDRDRYQRPLRQGQRVLCRILHKDLYQEWKDQRIRDLLLYLHIVLKIVRVAQQQYLEIILTVRRLRRHRDKLMHIAEYITQVFRGDPAHLLRAVVLAKIDHAVDEVQAVEIKVRPDLEL